jgi:hypothetical protein
MTEGIPFTEEMLISAAMIAVTVFFHAVIIAATAAVFRATASTIHGAARFLRDSIYLTLLSLVLMAAHGVEILMWAVLFLNIDAFSSFEAAFYFSASAYTTLGFGDVLLPDEWRLLGGTVAADGFLLFGLSAAFLFETAARLRLGGARAN